MRPYGSAAITLLALILVLCGFRRSYNDDDECLLSYRNEPPVYKHLISSGAYTLYLFRENERVYKLGGTPVLFIPGNAGSYRQGLALASLCSKYPEFDWYLLDFDEDLSVIHGRTMVNEALFANEAIQHILGIYESNDDKSWTGADAESVIVVGHSMGGIVARTLTTLDNYKNGSVNTIYTLSTPHAQPPLTFDLDITQLYDAVGHWWRSNASDSIELVSIAGGHMDHLIPPGLTLADSFGGLSVLSYEIPTVGIGINHLAIVWCVQLRRVIIDAMVSIADHTSPQRTLAERRHIIERALKTQDAGVDKGDVNYSIGAKLLYGLSHTLHLPAGNSRIELPSRSSLISYQLKTNHEVLVSQYTPLEYRSYGFTDNAILMWSSASPYVPFHKPGPPRLVLQIGSEDDVDVTVSVNWPTTLANMAMYYRTILASWHFAVILGAYILSMWNINSNVPPKDFLTHYVLGQIAGKWFLLISATLSVVHILCTNTLVRAFLRLYQILSEKAVVALLNYRNYDNNDILLGIMEPHLFWVAPVVFAISCWVTAAMVGVVYLIIYVKSLFMRGRIPAKIEKPDNSNMETQKRFTSRWMLWVSFLAFIYIVPFQASVVLFTVVAILRLKSRRDYRLPLVMIMLSAALVDSPIVVIWLRTFTMRWLMSFAGIVNGAIAWAFGVFAFKKVIKYEFSKVLFALLVYWSCYTVIYGGLHSFMVHFMSQIIISLVVLQNF